MPRVAAAKHEQYAEARRDQILDAALRIFARKGFAESTVDEIAVEAGLAKATLYLYFPSKEALLQKLVDHYRLVPDLGGLMESIRDLPPVGGIPRLVAGIWRQLKEHKEAAHVLVREIFSNPQRAKLYTEQIRLPGQQAAGELPGNLDEAGQAQEDPSGRQRAMLVWDALVFPAIPGTDGRQGTDAAVGRNHLLNGVEDFSERHQRRAVKLPFSLQIDPPTKSRIIVPFFIDLR